MTTAQTSYTTSRDVTRGGSPGNVQLEDLQCRNSPDCLPLRGFPPPSRTMRAGISDTARVWIQGQDRQPASPACVAYPATPPSK